MKSCNWPIGTYLSLLLVMTFFISGCAPTTQNAERPTETIASSSALPVIVDTPTSSPTPLALTIKIEQECLSLENQLPTDMHLEGVWVRQSGKPYLENLEENIKYGVPLYGGSSLTKTQGHWSVSPNGEWLAYLDAVLDTSERIIKTNGYSLRVIHSSGYSLSMDYWPMSSFYTIKGWIDNQNLLLSLDNRDIVLNPFSGRWYELKKPKWLEKTLSGVSWFNSYQYSPHLNQVIVHLEDHSEVKDVASGENVFGNSKLGFFSKSSWSPDGTMLAVNNGNVLHVLKGDSEILEIDFDQLEILSKSYDGNIDVENLAWSLDNQRILIETSDNSTVLDIDERKVYDICFIDNNFSKDWVYVDGFFTSKNGRYIIMQRAFINEEFYVQYVDLLIDITNMRAYKLPDIAYKNYVGWLALP